MTRAPAMALAAALGTLALLMGCEETSVRRPESSKADTASSYNVQLGIAYLQQGNLAVAQEKLERALKQNPRDPNVHSALGMLEERLGNPRKADERFREALQLAPHSPDILNNYAVFLCRAGRSDEGVKRFEEAARDPLYRAPEAAYTNAGVCLLGAKRYPEAEQELLRAQSIQPNYSEAVLQLGELYLAMGRLTDAKARVDAYLENFREGPEILWLAVRVARSRGDRPAAERYARRMRMNYPDSDQTRLLSESGRAP